MGIPQIGVRAVVDLCVIADNLVVQLTFEFNVLDLLINLYLFFDLHFQFLDDLRFEVLFDVGEAKVLCLVKQVRGKLTVNVPDVVTL